MDRTRVLNGAVPAAGKPGMGAGNVPFAPGLMSGRQPGQPPAPLARQSSVPARTTPQTAPPPAPKGQPPAPGGQPTVPAVTAPQGIDAASGVPFTPPGMPGPTNPWPMIYMQLLDSWMKAIMESANKPLIGGMY